VGDIETDSNRPANKPAQSFFTIYRNLFARLAHDEAQFGQTDLPSFGYSSWPWTPTVKGEEDSSARKFYAIWTNISTAKDFTWAEQWNLSEAPERRVRRLVTILLTSSWYLTLNQG
jgi:DnaJ homolog subfamily A member 5